MNNLVYLLAVIALVACTEKPKEITSSIFSTAEDTIAEADTTASVDTIPAVVDTPKVVPVLKKEIKQKDTVAAPKPVEKPNQAYDADSVLARHSRSGGTNMGCDHKGECVVYLTSDDGPSQYTPKVLDILREEDVKATFFVTGNGGSYTKCIGQAYQEGHAIAAHTYNHDFANYATLESYFKDLERIEDLIEKQIGQRTRVIRFPGGSTNTVFYKHARDPLYMVRLTQAVQDSGYQYVDWNVSSEDATGLNIPVETIIESSCTTRSRDICLLMHDARGKSTTVEALPEIIRFYKENGYEFRTITDTTYICHHGVRPYSGPKPAMAKK